MRLDRTLSSNGGFWFNQFSGWLSNTATTGVLSGNKYDDTWKQMIAWWNSEEAKKIEDKMLRMETMFSKIPQSIEAYADFFGLTLESKDWDHLKRADISKK